MSRKTAYVCAACARDHEPRRMAADAGPDGPRRADEPRGDLRRPAVLELGLGRMGTILAVPMLMVIKAVCDRIEDLQPVGELLGE